jgi:hypothetical protein
MEQERLEHRRPRAMETARTIAQANYGLMIVTIEPI